MSYDLFFEAGAGKKLDKKSFAAHFRARRHYEVDNGQAIYQNENTGVYFILDEPEDGVVAMNLNLYRPHTFGLEAVVEIEAFAKAFDATVVDPQRDAEPGPFERDPFLRSYNEANRFAYQSMMSDSPSPHTWPTKRIREVWSWNYTRPTDEQQDAAEVFIPTIFAALIDDEVRSIVVWPPGCPIMMPAVDAVMVPLAQEGRASEKVALVPWSQIAPVVTPHQQKSNGIARYLLNQDPWPDAIERFLATKRSEAPELNGVGMDEILDREVVEAARNG